MMDHVLCDCRLVDVNPKQLKFAVNPRCAPANVVSRHRPDKFAYLGCDGWVPSHSATGLPGPVQSKSLAVPAHQDIWFEDLQFVQAIRPQSAEPDPEQPLTPVKSESFMWRLVYHGQLLAKRQDSRCRRVRLRSRPSSAERTGRAIVLMPGPHDSRGKKVNEVRTYDVFGSHYYHDDPEQE